MIHFITGKPGGGKGLFAMKLVIDELLQTERPIITNLAIRVDPWVDGAGRGCIGLAHYLAKKYKRTNIDFKRRIVVLTDEQCFEFFRYRADGIECLKDKDGNGFDTAAAVASGGVLYVIDECWQFFSSRFSKVTPSVQFYAAQHRKLGDDVLLVTQSSKQVVPAIRELAQDFTVIRNHGKERLGLFRQPPVFVASTYQEPPSANSKASYEKPFLLDKKGMAQCYDTTSGVGITGRASGDLESRKKGWSPWFIIGALGLVLAFLLGVPMAVKHLTQHYFGRVAAAVIAPKKGNLEMPSFTGVKKNPPAGTLDPVDKVATIKEFGGVTSREEKPVYLTGFAFVGMSGKVWLSDGRSFHLPRRGIQIVNDNQVSIDGVQFLTRPQPEVKL